MQTPHEQVESLLGQMRKIAHSPAMDRLSDEISVLTRAFMVPAVENDWKSYGLSASLGRMMDLLAANPGKTVAKAAFMNALYFDRPDDEPQIKIVDVYICKIRAAFAHLNYADPIQTIWGVGYRFDPAMLGKPKTAVAA